MKEIRVYAVNVDSYTGCEDLKAVSDLRFIEIAEEQGNVWSLMGFQATWNDWEFCCPNPGNCYIRFIEVECSESINFEEWAVPVVKEE